MVTVVVVAGVIAVVVGCRCCSRRCKYLVLVSALFGVMECSYLPLSLIVSVDVVGVVVVVDVCCKRSRCLL